VGEECKEPTLGWGTAQGKNGNPQQEEWAVYSEATTHCHSYYRMEAIRCWRSDHCRNLATFQLLKKEGFDGFLMGEYFMKQENPAKAFEEFSKQINL
jgi:indole-3-glycerol phosphate synthase